MRKQISKHTYVTDRPNRLMAVAIQKSREGKMIAPKEVVRAVGHWKPAGRIYGEAIKLQGQGFQYKEALEIAMRNPKNWEGFEGLK